jgi:lipopolysaccharide transport system ATP-binding protein
MSEPAIRVTGLGKKYRIAHGQQRGGYRTLRETLVDAVKAPFRKRATQEDFWALSDVSFEVQPGEVVGIIGRNGAGKSTLLKILSRITKPTTGMVELNGRVGSLLEVGTGFHPELTGRENIYLNGSILGMSRAEVRKKFDEIVAFAEVEKFLDTPVKRYSSGMYVRLAFAVAAHLEPEILIVDEVLAVGDAAFQKKCMGRMGKMAGDGRAILFVSHQMSAVQALCSHAALIERGTIRCIGLKSDIIAEYIATSSRAGVSGEWQLISAPVSKSSSGRAWFAAMRFSSESPESAGLPYPDGEAVIDLKIMAREAINPIYIAVGLYDRYDTCLIRCDSGRLATPLRLAPGENLLRLRIDHLHLNPGVYRTELWMADGVTIVDRVPDVIGLPVSEYRPDLRGRAMASDGMVTGIFRFEKISFS